MSIRRVKNDKEKKQPLTGYRKLAFLMLSTAIDDIRDNRENHIIRYGNITAHYFFKSGSFAPWADILGIDKGLLMDRYNEVAKQTIDNISIM